MILMMMVFLEKPEVFAEIENFQGGFKRGFLLTCKRSVLDGDGL